MASFFFPMYLYHLCAERAGHFANEEKKYLRRKKMWRDCQSQGSLGLALLLQLLLQLLLLPLLLL